MVFYVCVIFQNEEQEEEKENGEVRLSIRVPAEEVLLPSLFFFFVLCIIFYYFDCIIFVSEYVVGINLFCLFDFFFLQFSQNEGQQQEKEMQDLQVSV